LLHLKRLLARATLAGVAFCAGLLVAEIALRLAGVSYPSIGQVDPVRGWSARPGASARKDLEGEAFVTINADGLRDRDHERRKPPGAFRVAVLGDSFTLAAQVPLEETFWSRLERRLADCPALAGRTPEVINFGVSGYGTAQELLTLRHHAWDYDPDLVLLAFFTGNDVQNNARALSGDPLAPYFELSAGRLVLDDRFRHSRQYRLKRWTYAVLYRSRVAQVVKHVLAATQAGRLRRALDEAIAAETDARLYEPPRTAAWEQAWAVTEALLAETASEVRARGAKFLVATLSNAIQVLPDPALRRRLLDQEGITDPWYPDQRVAQIGRRHAFDVLVLAPLLLAEAERRGEPLHGFPNRAPGSGHWNAAGHAAAGDRIAERACQLLADAAADSTSNSLPALADQR